MADTEFIVILSTCKTRTEAETIASRLVADRAAACVSIVDGITSIYEWQGKIEKGAECLLVIKSRASLADRIEAIIKELSSYDCPEVVALPVSHGSSDYLGWILDNTGSE